ncbi:MAG: 50S ribosomal protein L24 [Patescibacteria group bacterium]|nr:50S ribosomal protein L24 [Patescibacteria group bacterium]
MKLKLKQNDTVIVLTGKDKGKTGVIQKVLPKKQSVIVSGINVYKRHMKKRDEKHPGGIIEITCPIHISNVALFDKKSKKSTRVGYVLTSGEKIRIAKRSGEVI